MDAFTEIYLATFTPFVVTALIGGLLGAAASADVETFKWRLTIIMTLLTLGAVGAGSEYLTKEFPDAGIFWHLLEGGIVGMVGLRLLDALRVASPTFTKKLVEIASNSLLDNVSALFKKLTDLFK